ncbi:MAG TPA: dihydrofolate reductase family protein [Micromonosporaceae bacterium]|nr:dihydrofolate reductase family protein [Micromonosporaceae bacterium]
MRKIVAGLFVSLDGVVEAPQNWHFPYFNDEMGAIVQSQIDASDTLLMGRGTYDEFVQFWPTAGSEVELADHMNGVEKIVVSTTLKDPTWQNTTVIGDDVAQRVRALKELPGRKNIGMSGSPGLVRWLINNDLLDEVHLLVHPIIVGEGKRLFTDDNARKGLTLTDSRILKTGVLSLVYAPVAE